MLRILLFPVSLVYGLVVYLRNLSYDLGWVSAKTFKTSTLCIGNLSVGGTGKTPMAEYLIAYFSQHYKVALLSRGYRRSSTGFMLANEKSTVQDLGDEPFQIYRKFSNISVAVDIDRCNGVRTLENQIQPDLIILDDAFQHRKLACDFYMLLTTYNDLYCNDWYLPTGNLRDSKNQAGRANIIVVTKCPPALTATERQLITSAVRVNEDQNVLFSSLTYAAQLENEKEAISIDFLKNKKFALVTGIANPKPLIKHLKKMGLDFTHHAFQDHHTFSARELTELRKEPLILTTEKDYTRLAGKLGSLYFIRVAHQFSHSDAQWLEKQLAAFMKSKS